LIEIKPGVSDDVVRQTVGMCKTEQCVVQSFDAQILRMIASSGATLALELLVDDAREPIPSGPWRAVNAEFKTLDTHVVKRLRSSGLRVGAWTVNDDSDIRRMLRLGIDTIISDRPLRARDICREIG
jgi:glycerophosphoryl diester phosphodiesterase